MNPLDLNGPDFLVLYGVCGAVVCLVLYLVRLREPQTPDGAVPKDPQAIAYLRGGALETLRITAVTLLERGVLLLGPHDTMRIDPNHKLPRDGTAIDRLVHEHFASETQALSLFKDESLALRVAAHLARPLEEAGLLPDDALRAARWSRLLTAAGGLGILAAVKIAVALNRGHSNVGLLVIEAAVFGVIACRLTIRHRTPAGDRALAYLTQTFEPLRRRTRPMPHPGHEDIALVAAVFGLAALPEAPYANVGVLQPRQDGGGCGGGGGPDGGGGGGGGCGGCGGCGG